MIYTLTRENAGELSQLLGKRPDKRIDAEYLRKSPWNENYMFWSQEDGKYLSPIRYGTQIEFIEGQPPRLVR